MPTVSVPSLVQSPAMMRDPVEEIAGGVGGPADWVVEAEVHQPGRFSEQLELVGAVGVEVTGEWRIVESVLAAGVAYDCTGGCFVQKKISPVAAVSPNKRASSLATKSVTAMTSTVNPGSRRRSTKSGP